MRSSLQLGRKIIIKIDKNITENSSVPKSTEIQLSRNPPRDIYGNQYESDPYDMALAAVLCKIKPDYSHGEGSSSIITWNPELSYEVDQIHDFIFKRKSGESSYISLANELIHSYFILNGEIMTLQKPLKNKINKLALDQENKVIGIGRFENERFTENKIRKEHGLIERTKYFSI